MLETIKKDWDQKYTDAVGWRVLAKTAVQYKPELEEGRSAENKLGDRPAVVAPTDVDASQPKAQRKVKEKEPKKGWKSPTGTHTRKVGKPMRTTVPSPEEVK